MSGRAFRRRATYTRGEAFNSQGTDRHAKGSTLLMTTDVFQPLRLEYERLDDTVVVRVIGEVDVAASPILREALVELIDGMGALSITLDLGEMGFLDSTGVGVLVGALRSVRAKGGSLVLTQIRPNVRKVLDIAGLLEIFGVTPPEGVAAAGPA